MKWFAWVLEVKGCTPREAMLQALELQRGYNELEAATCIEKPAEEEMPSESI